MRLPLSLSLSSKIIITAVFTLLLADIGGHIIYKVRDGNWLWEENPLEIFKIHGFLEFVADERLMTGRKMVINVEYGYAFDQNRFWTSKTLRPTGQPDISYFGDAQPTYAKDTPSIVFLGDSVPFGWEIMHEQTVPSRLFGLLRNHGVRKYGVINAAVPSYSLHQSVARYAKEIHGTFPVSVVILQVYDPANRLLEFGQQWTRNTNGIVNPSSMHALDIKESLFYRWSSIGHTVLTMRLALADDREKFSKDDADLRKYFTQENEKDLITLLDLVRNDGAFLVLLPVNPAESYKERLGSGSAEPLLHSIDWLNSTFDTFAKTHDDVYFFDVSDEFDRIGREGNFLDLCCHLSATGATAQAEFLYEKLVKSKLL